MDTDGVRHLGANLPLLTSSAVAMLREDPALFAVQVVRRTPHGVRDALSSLPEPSGLLASLRPMWLLMLDRTRDLREELQARTEESSALLDTLRLQVGTAPGPGASARARARARGGAGGPQADSRSRGEHAQVGGQSRFQVSGVL